MATDTRLDFDELARLEEERRFLLRSLDDLEREHDAGDIDEADYHTLKDDYTRRAVTVLRAIEAGEGVVRSPSAPGRPHCDHRRGGRARRGARRRADGEGRGTSPPRAVGIGQASRRTATTSSSRLVACWRAGKAVDAIKLYDQVLTLQPDNPEALAYRGWLLYQTGDADLLSTRASSSSRTPSPPTRSIPTRTSSSAS